MSNIAQLVKDSNVFSRSEILIASEQLFRHIVLDVRHMDAGLEIKAIILDGFIEMLRQSLYGEKANELEKNTKVQLVKLLAKLKKQLEIIELLKSKDKDSISNLALAGERMDSKNAIS